MLQNSHKRYIMFSAEHNGTNIWVVYTPIILFLTDTQLKHVNLFLGKKNCMAGICDHKEKQTMRIFNCYQLISLRKNCYKRLLVKQWR